MTRNILFSSSRPQRCTPLKRRHFKLSLVTGSRHCEERRDATVRDCIAGKETPTADNQLNAEHGNEASNRGFVSKNRYPASGKEIQHIAEIGRKRRRQREKQKGHKVDNTS